MSENTLGSEDALTPIDEIPGPSFSEANTSVESAVPAAFDGAMATLDELAASVAPLVPPTDPAPLVPPTDPVAPHDEVDAAVPPRSAANTEPAVVPPLTPGLPEVPPEIAPELWGKSPITAESVTGGDADALAGLAEPDMTAFADNVAPASTSADEAAPYWFHQTYKSSCLPSSVAGILSLYNSEQFTEDDLLALLTPQERFDIMYKAGLPVPVAQRLLEEFEIDATVELSTIQELDRLLEEGYGAIVAVDGGEVWYRDPNDPRHEALEDNLMDHVMMITDIDIEGGWVYVNDSGSLDGRALPIPLELFLDAWMDSGNQIIRIDTSLEDWREAKAGTNPTIRPGDPQPIEAEPVESAAPSPTLSVSDEGASPQTSAVVGPDSTVLSELVKHPWIIIPGVIALGGATTAAIAAARKPRGT